jgi:hypothetical protein
MRVDNVLRKRSGRLKAHQFHLELEAQLRAFVLWQRPRRLSTLPNALYSGHNLVVLRNRKHFPDQ